MLKFKLSHTLPSLLLGLALMALSPSLAVAAGSDTFKAPPPSPYQPVSKLVPLPDFLPGLGTLYVDPATLPVGPFLTYDRRGTLVSTVYMVPSEDLDPKHPKDFPVLAAGQKRVDHVSLHFNAGHPGVTVPHYHIIVWYISPQQVAALK